MGIKKSWEVLKKSGYTGESIDENSLSCALKICVLYWMYIISRFLNKNYSFAAYLQVSLTEVPSPSNKNLIN